MANRRRLMLRLKTRALSVKPNPVHFHRASSHFRRLALTFGGAAFLGGTSIFAATAPPDAAGANPAPPSLLARLPDPSRWQKSPLENVVKGDDPIVNDASFKALRIAAQRHDANAALKALRDLTTRFPDKYPGLHENRGILALRFRFIGEAENSFRRVTKIAPKLPIGWYSLACVEVAQNRFPAAEADLRTSVNASGSFAFGWVLLAACQVREGKTADAITSATRATQVSPNKAEPWIILGQCKLHQGKPANAVGDLQRATSIEGNNLLANATLGSCYVQMNQPAKAVAPYEQAHKIAPANPAICRQLGYCYLATGQVAAAENICRQGVKAQPKYAPAWDMLGLCYRREGKQREAVDAFQHAVNAAPRDLNARTHLDEARLAPAPTHA